MQSPPVIWTVGRSNHTFERFVEYGPGALLGERAHLEGRVRTSTLVGVTPCGVASIEAAQLERGALHELPKGHRREGQRHKEPVRG